MQNIKYACGILLILMSVVLTASSFAANEPYVQEIQKWQEKRLKNLQAEDGWPTLAGLFWLKEGENAVGSDPSFLVVLPATAPKAVGTLKLSNGKVDFQPESGVEVTADGRPVTESIALFSDENPKVKPTLLQIGPVSFFIIKRGDKIGVRVRDVNSIARKQLSSLEYYPVDPSWRVEATFEPYQPVKKIPIVNILGMVEDTDSVGALVFKIKGTTYRLDVLQEENDKGEKEFFVIFGDGTNSKETYGAGRYLYTSTPDKDGKVILDFNKAYSPPCAFTNYATCPLPPKQNKLPILITAGEKRPPHPHS